MSPWSLLSHPARPLASCFTIPVMAQLSSLLLACRATAGHSFTFPDQEGRLHCLTRLWSIWLCFKVWMHVCMGMCVFARVFVSARHFARSDRMTRWAVINELSTEHFWPSGKRVPWRCRPVSGHRGRGAGAQRVLCLCQEPPENSCMGPAHLDNTQLTNSTSSVCTHSEKSRLCYQLTPKLNTVFYELFLVVLLQAQMEL